MLSSVTPSASFSSCSRRGRRKAAAFTMSRSSEVAEWAWSHVGEVRLEARQRCSRPSQSAVLPLACCTFAFQCAPWGKLAGASAGQGACLGVKQALCRTCVHGVSSHSLCGCFSFISWNKYTACVYFWCNCVKKPRDSTYKLRCWFGLNTGISCCVWSKLTILMSDLINWLKSHCHGASLFVSKAQSVHYCVLRVTLEGLYCTNEHGKLPKTKAVYVSGPAAELRQ